MIWLITSTNQILFILFIDFSTNSCSPTPLMTHTLDSQHLMSQFMYIRWPWLLFMPPVTSVALAACSANVSALCLPGGEVLVVTTACFSRPIQMPRACAGSMLPEFVNSSLSNSREGFIHAHSCNGSLV